jgi:hypothetical protein
MNATAHQGSLPNLSEKDLQGYLDAYLRLTSRYWVAVHSLFVSFFGQAMFIGSWARTHPDPWLGWLVFVPTLLPWLLVFALTFVRVPPPISPRSFRRAMLLAVYCYATTTLVFVLAAALGAISFDDAPLWVATLAWACALCGWLAVPELLRCARALSRDGAASG